MNHIIAVLLTAKDVGLKSVFRKSAAEVTGFGKTMEQTSKRTTSTWAALGKPMMAGGLAIAGALAMAVSKAAAFEKEMSNLAAVSGASGEELRKLSEQAIEAGAATMFSATEAARAQSELAKAGVSVADILGGALPAALDLAAAGEIDVANAANVTAKAMNTFGLEGDDAARIADALAAGANKSATDIPQLSMALEQAGLVANQFGLSMEETVGALSLFAQNGLEGSDAGTSLKNALIRLGAPTKESAALMQQLGINVYDAQGQILPLSDIADELKDSLGGMSEAQRNAALATIFGTDAIRVANILYKEGGDGVKEWTGAVSDAGYAQEVAAKKTDNLAGDIERLGGAIESALIQGGAPAIEMIRGLVRGLTNLVDVFGNLPRPIQGGITALAGVAASALLIGGAAAFLGPKIRTMQTGLQGLGTAGMLASRGLGTLGAMLSRGGPLIIGGFLLGGVLNKISDAASPAATDIEELARSLRDFDSANKLSGASAQVLGEDFGKLAEAWRELDAPNFGQQMEHVADEVINVTAEVLSFGQANVSSTKSVERAKQKLQDFDAALSQIAASDPDLAMDLLRQAADELGISVEELKSHLPETSGALKDVAAAEKKAAEDAKELESGMRLSAEAVMEMQAALDGVLARAPSVGQAMSNLKTPGGNLTAEFAALSVAMAGADLSAEELEAVANDLGIDLDVLQGHVDATKQVIEGLQQTAVGAIPGIGDIASQVDDLANVTATQLRDTLSNMLIDLTQFNDNIKLVMAERPLLSGIAAQSPEFARLIGDMIRNGNTKMLDEMELLAAGLQIESDELPKIIQNASPAFIQELIDLGVLSTGGFETNYKPEVPATTKTNEAKINIMKQKDAMFRAGAETGSQGHAGFGRGLSPVPGTAQARINEAKVNISKAKDGMFRAGADTGSSGNRGFSGGIAPVPGTAETRMEEARLRIRNKRDQMHGAGGHTGLGGRQGFESGLTMPNRASVDPIVRKWLNIVTSAITDIFQIFSPARTMVPYGQKVSEGLLEGIISNRAKMKGVIKAMGIDVGKWMSALFPGGRGGGNARGLVGFAARYFGLWRAMFPWMTIGGWRARGSVPGSDHPKGKALDLMTTNGMVAARIIGTFLQQPGAKYWIWNRQMATAASGWRIRPYSGPSPHTDHVHLSYFRRGGILPENVLGFGGSGRGYYLHAQERVVPVGGDGGSVNDFRTFVNVRVTARGSITDQRGLMRAIEDVTRTEIAESHKRLARELASR